MMSWTCAEKPGGEQRIGEFLVHTVPHHRISLNFEMKGGCHRKIVTFKRSCKEDLKKVSHLRNASLRQLEISCISNSYSRSFSSVTLHQ